MPTGKELVLGTLFKGRVDPAFENQLKRVENALRRLNKAIIATNTHAKAATQGVNALGRAAGTAAQGPKQLSKDTEVMNKQIAKAADGYSRFMGALKVTASYGIASAAIYAVINALKGSVTEIIKYDQALKNLQAIKTKFLFGYRVKNK